MYICFMFERYIIKSSRSYLNVVSTSLWYIGKVKQNSEILDRPRAELSKYNRSARQEDMHKVNLAKYQAQNPHIFFVY